MRWLVVGLVFTVCVIALVTVAIFFIYLVFTMLFAATGAL